MSEIFLELINGFFSLLNVEAFLIMTIGVFLGIIFGALPGLSATTGMAL